MFKTQNTFERIKLSRQLEETFLSLYDPEHKLPPLNSLRTTRKIMNRMIHVIKYFIEVVRNNSILSSIVPSYYEDDLKFIDALFHALQKTNIKLAFTPSKVPPKEYDNFDVLYYHGRDIEEEDPMIVENADDLIFTPTLNSENKNPLSSTKEDKEEMPILEKLYRATRNPTILMNKEKIFELFPVDDRIEFLQDEIRSYCCKLNKEDEEDKEDYYKYLLDIFKSIKKREKETDD